MLKRVAIVVIAYFAGVLALYFGFAFNAVEIKKLIAVMPNTLAQIVAKY